MQAEVLTDTVEDNHVIVDGVSDDGKDSRDERLVDVEVERQDTREQGEEADDDDGGMRKGYHTTEAPGPAPESPCDVGEDDEEGEDNGDDCGTLDVAGDRSSDLVGRDDTVGIVVGIDEVFESEILGVHSLEGVEDHLLDLGVHGGSLVIYLVGGGDLHLGLAAELLDLDRRLRIGCIEHALGSLADIFSGDRLVEAYDVGTTTGEIDTIGEALDEDGTEGDQNEGAGDDV